MHTYYLLKMCLLIVEKYAVCGCVYKKHDIDPCAAYGQRYHYPQVRDVLVGYACSPHSVRAPPAKQRTETPRYPSAKEDKTGYGSAVKNGRNWSAHLLPSSAKVQFIIITFKHSSS